MSEETSVFQSFRQLIKRYPQATVYLALVLVVVFAISLNWYNQQNDARERCLGGVDTRNVLRAQTDSIYDLAGSTLLRDADSPPLTERDRRIYNNYVERLNSFRDDLYAQIKPSAPCAQYVSDDNVKPSSPPLRPLTRRDNQ